MNGSTVARAGHESAWGRGGAQEFLHLNNSPQFNHFTLPEMKETSTAPGNHAALNLQALSKPRRNLAQPHVPCGCILEAPGLSISSKHVLGPCITNTWRSESETADLQGNGANSQSSRRGKLEGSWKSTVANSFSPFSL